MRAVRDDATEARCGRDDEPGGRTRTARRRHVALLSALAFLLAACGTATPAPDPKATPSVDAVAATPLATASINVKTATANSVSADRTVSMGMAAARAPILYYRGRVYMQFGFGAASAEVASLQPDREIGATFSRWQSNGMFPAGTAIYSVAGQPVERMLAVQGPERTAFFRARDSLTGLDNYQVVQGTVTSFGPGRWSTPDGQPPPQGQKPSDPGYVHASIYTPATVVVERTLHGLIPAGQEIEVRQLGGIIGTTRYTISTGGVIPLAPGSTVILLLTPGQWSSGGPGSYTPPGDYYWLWTERAYAIANGQATPLGVPDGAGDQVPLDRFLTGLAETFGGVATLDPYGPTPTPVPPPPTSSPAPTATPRFAVGQLVNLVREYRLDAAQALYLKGKAVPEDLRSITDPARVEAIVVALDVPLPAVAPPPPPRTQQDYADIVIVGFTVPGGKNVPFEYNRKTGTLTNRADYANPVAVAAPPDLARTLGLP